MHGITVIPLKEDAENRMVYVKREDAELSQCAQDFIEMMQVYFDRKKG